jgi:hypothetical protein
LLIEGPLETPIPPAFHLSARYSRALLCEEPTHALPHLARRHA